MVEKLSLVRRAPAPMPDGPEADLVGRLRPPRQHVTMVVRGALLDRLDATLFVSLALILSPAGFGKTTLLTQWWRELAARQDIRVAWLSLDEDDADLRSFVAHLFMALQDAGLNFAHPPQAVLRQLSDPDVSSTVLQLLDAVAAGDRHVVLIIDDLHRARSAAIDRVLDILVRQTHAPLTVVVAARGPGPARRPDRGTRARHALRRRRPRAHRAGDRGAVRHRPDP